VNLVLALLVMLDAVLLLQRRPAVAGVGMGLAAAIKLTPVVFLVYLVVSRQRRAAATAVGTVVAATLLAAAVDWRTSWQFWTETLWTTSRVGRYDSTPNQSAMGLLARLADDPLPSAWLWALACVLLLALGLTRAVRAHRRGDEITAFVIVGLTGCLLSPISWTHHLVWVYPAVLLLGTAAVFRRSWWYLVAAAATYGVFASSMVWLWRRNAPHHWDLGLPGIVLENAYVLGLIALVALLPIRTPGRAPRTPPPPPPPR
jgi:alpha-1,2-mannosyltransferase